MIEHCNFTAKGYEIVRYHKAPHNKNLILDVKNLKKINKVVKELQINLGKKPTPEMTKFYVSDAYHKLDKLVAYSIQ